MMRMKNEFFLNIYDVEALNGLFRLDFTHYKSEDGVRADLAVTFSREWGGRMREESMTVGSGILKDDQLVLKIQHDEIPFSIELDRIGIGRILNESTRRIQDFPDDKIQTFTTQYLDVTDFYRDYMKDKAEKVASSPIDELYITYDNNRRYMTARVGDIWLPEKDVTFGMAALSYVPEDKAYDYQRYEKAEEYYQVELARIAVQSRPVAEGLDKPVPVDIGADEPMLRQAMDYVTGLHGGEAVFSKEMTNYRWQRLTDRMTAGRQTVSQPVERSAEMQARMNLIEQVQLLYNPPVHSQSELGEYKIRCKVDGGWTFLQELQEEDVLRVNGADRSASAWQDLQKELAAEYFSEYLDEMIEMKQEQQQGGGMKR